MGGIVGASRSYRQINGKGRAKIEVATDSPLIQSLGMMLSNPMFIGGGKKSRLVRVHGQKGMLEEEGENNFQLLLLIEGKVLVTVKAWRTDGADEMVMYLANHVDFDKLRKIIK